MAADSGGAAGLIAAAPPAVQIETFDSAAHGLAQQERLGDEAADGRPRILLWRAPRALVVGRSDSRLPRFAAAMAQLGAEGWPVVIRRSGGTACPVSPGTLQVALARTACPASGIDTAYRELATILAAALTGCGLRAEIGLQRDAFCPGRYDLAVSGRKIAGLSQHWRLRGSGGVVTTAATLLVDDDIGESVRAVNLFYAAAGGPDRCTAAAVTDLRTLRSDAAGDSDVLQRALCARIVAACGAEHQGCDICTARDAATHAAAASMTGNHQQR